MTLVTHTTVLVKRYLPAIAYPLLRVEISKKPERANEPCVPKTFWSSARAAAARGRVDCYLSTPTTAKASGLAELAAQFTIGAFQQGSGAHELARDATQGIKGNRLLKIPLQRTGH